MYFEMEIALGLSVKSEGNRKADRGHDVKILAHSCMLGHGREVKKLCKQWVKSGSIFLGHLLLELLLLELLLQECHLVKLSSR